MNEKRFGVSLLFACHEASKDGFVIDVEEQIRLISALDSEDAHRAAAEIGRKNEMDYIAASGLQVYWRFIGISAMFEVMDDLEAEGAEVFSRHLGPDGAKSDVFRLIEKTGGP